MADDVSRAEVNRLYWESDRSVADIADHLGVSRRSLYDSIEPQPAGVPCPECGAALGFRNRTSADNLEAECGACGHETELERPLRPEEHEDPELEQEEDAGRLSPIPARRLPDHQSGALLGSTLLAGLALGAVAGWVLRRH